MTGGVGPTGTAGALVSVEMATVDPAQSDRVDALHGDCGIVQRHCLCHEPSIVAGTDHGEAAVRNGCDPRRAARELPVTRRVGVRGERERSHQLTAQQS